MKPAPFASSPAVHRPRWESNTGLAGWAWAGAVADACLATAATAQAINERSRHRLERLISFARSQSPYYRKLYGNIDATRPALSQLPVVTRPALMAHFDEWVTDPEVTLKSVERFVADRTKVGRAHLGRYAVWKSSGTTGDSGLFVHDASALAVYDALDSIRLGSGVLGPASALCMIVMGARYAMIGATGGHYAGVSSVERLRLLTPLFRENLRVLSVFDPLPRMLDALNHWQPAFVATHPSIANLLAAEQRAGTLNIRPAAIWLGGENLSATQRTSIRAAFECVVLEQYGASECMSIACSCAQGSLHLNTDWVMLEPVDGDYRSVAPGVMSHTVLLTNLANRVQPIIRYDLGDSVCIGTEPCECGSPLPTLQVTGRSDEVIRFRATNGRTVDLPPIALTTLLEESIGPQPFQVVHSGANALTLRMAIAETLWAAAERALRGYLDAQGLAHVTIEWDARPVLMHPKSGKLRRVVSATRPDH